VASVESRDRDGAEAFRGGDHGCVDGAEAKIGVSLDQVGDATEVVAFERVELE
jgi:hypothetical protein